MPRAGDSPATLLAKVAQERLGGGFLRATYSKRGLYVDLQAGREHATFALRDDRSLIEEWFAGDRDYALADSRGRLLNAKRLGGAIVSVRATYSKRGLYVDLQAGREHATFALRDDRSLIEEWFSRALGRAVCMRRDKVGGYPDDEQASGPTVLGLGSVDAVAGWFDLPREEIRRRFRANLEIADLDPFEEDLLFGPPGRPRRFRIGDVEFLGTNPCARCAVPTLDSFDGHAGGALTAKRFAQLRERNRRQDSEIALYKGYYRLAVNTLLPSDQDGKTLRLGDPLVPISHAIGSRGRARPPH